MSMNLIHNFLMAWKFPRWRWALIRLNYPELAAFIEEYGLTDIVSWAVPPGMRPDEMSPSLERYARDVAPRLRARFGST
jgi:hypothetical protein